MGDDSTDVGTRSVEEALPDRYHDVVRLLVENGSEVNSEWFSKPQIRADPAMADALAPTSRH
jgi:hypothetical protein